MHPNVSSQPSGMLTMTEHHTLLLSSLPSERLGRFQPSDYVLLYPYRYHVTDQSILRAWGKPPSARNKI